LTDLRESRVVNTCRTNLVSDILAQSYTFLVLIIFQESRKSINPTVSVRHANHHLSIILKEVTLTY